MHVMASDHIWTISELVGAALDGELPQGWGAPRLSVPRN